MSASRRSVRVTRTVVRDLILQSYADHEATEAWLAGSE
jgi:hypothetical protein